MSFAKKCDFISKNSSDYEEKQPKTQVFMKFVVSRSELSGLIRKIQNIVPQSAPIPILSHFLVEAEGDEVIFTATDLTVGSRCRTKAKIYENGSLSIPSKRFFQLVKELTEADIE